MTSNTAGVNPQDAHAGGVAAEQAAALLKDLPVDFDEAIQAVKNAMTKAPASIFHRGGRLTVRP